MYRVYSRESEPKTKWALIAAFVYKEDAIWFCRDKVNSDHEGELEYKVMQGSKVINRFGD